MRRLLLFVVVAVLAAACGGPEHLSVVGNSPAALGTGEHRVLVAYRSAEGDDLGSAEVTADLEVSREGGEKQTVPTEFAWIDEGVRGLYVATVTLDAPGRWTAVLRPHDGRPTLPTPFEVSSDPITPQVGEAAPASVTLVATDVAGDLSAITTDPDPEPGLYDITLADAVASGRPTVVAFSTPAFCITGTCGPLLDIVKEVRAANLDRDVNWVHVEIYDLEDVTNLALVPAVVEWELPSEPWVFVVDADGAVSHRFEGIIVADELAAAVAEVTDA